MADELLKYLEKSWALIEEHTTDPNISYLKKLFQQRKDTLYIIHITLEKIRALKELPEDSEACVKLVLDILLAEAVAAKEMVSEEKRTLLFKTMLKNLKGNEHILKQAELSNSFSSRLYSLLKLTLSLAAGAAALWFTGPYCALAARHLFSIGYVALHGEPNMLVLYSYFLPAQEWVGNFAFNYGPKILSVPTGIMSAQAIDVAAKALNQGQKIVAYAYQQTKQAMPFKHASCTLVSDDYSASAGLICCL